MGKVERGPKLDLNDKKVWLDPDNAEAIAQMLGLPDSPAFQDALNKFNQEVVGPAKITDFLSLVAPQSFKNRVNTET